MTTQSRIVNHSYFFLAVKAPNLEHITWNTLHCPSNFVVQAAFIGCSESFTEPGTSFSTGQLNSEFYTLDYVKFSTYYSRYLHSPFTELADIQYIILYKYNY